MPKKLNAGQQSAFEVANALDDAADAIKERSREAYGAGKITLDDYLTAISKETELRAEACLVVAKNLTQVLEEASAAGAEVREAIEWANARIREVRERKKALAIATALIALASAVASGNAGAIAAAAKALHELSKPPKK